MRARHGGGHEVDHKRTRQRDVPVPFFSRDILLVATLTVIGGTLQLAAAALFTSLLSPSVFFLTIPCL